MPDECRTWIYSTCAVPWGLAKMRREFASDKRSGSQNDRLYLDINSDATIPFECREKQCQITRGELMMILMRRRTP